MTINSNSELFDKSFCFKIEPLIQRLNISEYSKLDGQETIKRIQENAPQLWYLLSEIYPDFETDRLLTKLLNSLIKMLSLRPSFLLNKDHESEKQSPWYLDSQQVGYACYVDRFAKDLEGLKSKIPYLKELGVTFLHLLPLYQSPEGENDGGYAVSDYRKVNPKLGDIAQLTQVIREFNKNGIRIVLDFVFNHTSDEHEWAKKAIKGEKKYQDYYFLYDDRTIPDQYDPFLREIFPHARRGCFSHREDINKWVWTTFNSYQWDLNYSNPEVLISVVEEMLYLSNIGCDVLRLDALSFIWKDPNTNCESRPNAYKLINLLNICLKIVAPAVVFKSEAIVHPDEVAKYIEPNRCQLSYNPLLMGLLWSSLATQETDFINQSMSHRFQINNECAWVNYVRCHDDIGWFFDSKDAESAGIDLDSHLKYLHTFYTDETVGSFAKGVPFQSDPSLKHQGLCGSLASLSGLEIALTSNNPRHLKLAILRILLLHSVIMSIGGIPLIYAGDEFGSLNDYSYLDDDVKKKDARWVNRPNLSVLKENSVLDSSTPGDSIYKALKHMISQRKKYSVFGKANTTIVQTNNKHLFVYHRRSSDNQNFLAVCNFSNLPQELELDNILTLVNLNDAIDLITQENVVVSNQSTLSLSEYQVMWIISG